MRHTHELTMNDLRGKTVSERSTTVGSTEEMERLFNENPNYFLHYITLIRNNNVNGFCVSYWVVD